MELNGDVSIAAPRAAVWAALNDPDVLARCIEGVESLTRVTGDDGERFEGKMNAKVGPVRATFTGYVTLADVMAPESYRLVGEGKGGVAGFAKGEAKVQLAETGPSQTLLSYQVASSVGGKLAQLGARLIEGTAKGLAESFFAKLKAEIETPAVTEVAPEVVRQEIEMSPEAAGIPILPPAGGLSPLIWGGGVILAVLAFLVWQWKF
jgi:carbon monoxide dehydrogenase subunit G